MELKYADEIYEMELEEVLAYHNNLVKFLSDKQATPVQAASVKCARKHYEDLKNGKVSIPKKTAGLSKDQSEAYKENSQVIDFFKGKADHKQHPIDEQFMPLGYETFFGNEVLISKLANKTMLYLILLKNKVDWDKNEKLNLYQDYFLDRNLIVASISRVKLARVFGCHKKTITNWQNQLQKDGLIKIERILCSEDDDQRHKYNVFILGKVMDDGTYKYLYEEK